MLTIRPIPAFNDNYIWLITHGDSTDAFVVDPGDAAVVNDALRRDIDRGYDSFCCDRIQEPRPGDLGGNR